MLNELVRISRAKPLERALCCPECGGDVEVDGLVSVRVLSVSGELGQAPRYVCRSKSWVTEGGCGWWSTTLAALAVREVGDV